MMGMAFCAAARCRKRRMWSRFTGSLKCVCSTSSWRTPYSGWNEFAVVVHQHDLPLRRVIGLVLLKLAVQLVPRAVQVVKPSDFGRTAGDQRHAGAQVVAQPLKDIVVDGAVSGLDQRHGTDFDDEFNRVQKPWPPYCRLVSVRIKHSLQAEIYLRGTRFDLRRIAKQQAKPYEDRYKEQHKKPVKTV